MLTLKNVGRNEPTYMWDFKKSIHRDFKKSIFENAQNQLFDLRVGASLKTVVLWICGTEKSHEMTSRR